MIPFMEHTTYLAAVEVPGVGRIYEPLIDPLGPYYFFPPHCYERKNRYNSPVIAYIPSGNQIEQDMVEQLEILFDKQRYLHDYVPKFTKALEDPQSTESIAIFLELLEGGTSDE